MSEQKSLKHIGIIMDGNRRWAYSKGKNAAYGHKAGADNIRRIVTYANKIGIKYLTVYAFSTENWKRSFEEVTFLMQLIEEYMRKFAKSAKDNNIKIRVIGNRTGLPESMQQAILETENMTCNCTGLVFQIALNYGGRIELVNAMKKIAVGIIEGRITPEDICEDTISNNLYTHPSPDPDLIIRTSNELRLSNFLPWQATYSELYFTNVHWPDFDEKQLDIAIEEYSKRNRRFGGNEQLQKTSHS